MHSSTTCRKARYEAAIMSRLMPLPASCSAAMAEAAVTPAPAPPLFTSLLPDTCLSSSIFSCFRLT